MENSIEADIAKVNTYIELVLEKDYCNCNELNTILGKHCDGSKNVAYAMQHILSDYKRVLKENEELLELKVSASAHNRILELEKENKELQKEIDQMKSLDIYKLVEDWETGQFIPVQKVKDKIEELKKKVEELTDDKGYWGGSDLLEQIKVLQELLESEERK